MVTFEDVLEELVGEIHGEHRSDDAQLIVRRDRSRWLVDRRLKTHELLDQLPASISLPDDTLGMSTVAGLVIAALKALPKIGDIVKIGGVQFEAMDMDDGRVDRILVVVDVARPLEGPGDKSWNSN